MKFLVTTIALALIAPLGCTDDSTDNVPEENTQTDPKSPLNGQSKKDDSFAREKTSFINKEKKRLSKLEAHIARLLAEFEKVEDEGAAEALADAKGKLLTLQDDGSALREQYADAANIESSQWSDIKESLKTQADSIENSLGLIVADLQEQNPISDAGFTAAVDETARLLAEDGNTREIQVLDDDRAALIARLEELKKSADRTLADLREIQTLQLQLDGVREGIAGLLAERNSVANQADQAATENKKRWQSVLEEVDELDNELQALFNELASTGDSEVAPKAPASDKYSAKPDKEQLVEIEENDGTDTWDGQNQEQEAPSIEDRLQELKSGADQTAEDIRRFDAIQAKLQVVRDQVDALKARRDAVAEQAGSTTATSRENWQSLQREVEEINEELETLYRNARR